MSDTSIQGLKTPSLEPSGGAGASAPAQDGRFGDVMRNVKQASVAQVRQGDTLIGIVKRHYGGAGHAIGEGQAYRLAQQLARENGIANANVIVPGQKLALDSLPLQASAASWARVQSQAVAKPQALAAQAGADVSPPARSPLRSYQVTDTHPVLERTLQRAVQKGFVPAHEVQAVHRRITDMADKYGFKPDDFAKVSLMESDGMNPKATNGSCHGIIQFCGGSGRGADSVGFGKNAKDILGLSVMQQLDLVDRYFTDVGLRPQPAGQLKLDDLYLSVLMPSARREKQAHVPLDIAGQQAARLYVGGNRSAAMTRQSIVQGLMQHATAKLGGDLSAPAKVAQATPPVSTDR